MTRGRQPSDPDLSSVHRAIDARVTSVDPRAHAAWRTWLAALAKDADAAVAAALVYQSLPPEGRDAWLDALDADAPLVDVPEVALFAPLLGVEQDEGRRARLVRRVASAPRRSTPPRAFVRADGDRRACLIVSPLYLQFVELLRCAYVPERGIEEAHHDALVHERELEARIARDLGGGVETPLASVVEELAHAVWADRRAGRAPPPALVRHIDLFAPEIAPPSAGDRDPTEGR